MDRTRHSRSSRREQVAAPEVGDDQPPISTPDGAVGVDAAPASAGVIRLSPVLDVQAAAPLMQALVEGRGQDLTLNGTDVQRLGAQCLQVLLSAQSAWRADNRALTIVSPSVELQAGLALLGVGPGSPLLEVEQFS